MTDGLEDAIVDGEYHFLDVGDEKYGECILAIFGTVRILFDGSHERDFKRQAGRKSIPEQLSEILGEEAPHQISLVVVTHGHADHIGCLPDLVASGTILAQWALLTHPKLGFGRALSDTAAHDAVGDVRERLAAALREEDASDLPSYELKDFIDSVSRVEPRYAKFIEDLTLSACKVELYQGQPLPQPLADLLRPTGAKLLGPSQNQLVLCAEQISKSNSDAMEIADALLRRDASFDDVALYRAAVEVQDGLGDPVASGRGNGMNCQSITFAFGRKNERVLLAGDMQFALPGVKDADEEVLQLREAVVEAGPYKVFKTTHHTAHNGQDDDFLTELGNPPIIIHSGGLKDPSHPNLGILAVLKNRRSSITFARTDRNGHITVRPHLEGPESVVTSFGRLNDFRGNFGDAEEENSPAPAPLNTPSHPVASPRPAAALAATPTTGPQIIIVNLPPGPIDMSVGGVEIQVREPGSKQVVIRDRAWSAGSRATFDPRPVILAGGRPLPDLLFVTNVDGLKRNIGKAEADAVVEAVTASGRRICEVGDQAADAVRAVQTELRRGARPAGIVLLGGYDVVPSNVIDVLGPAMRRQLPSSVVSTDDDHFLVWSDELYGDIDDDRVGELPVSRVPDARDSSLFMSALSTGGLGRTVQCFGVRNFRRPFADTVWSQIGGDRACFVSEKFLHTDVDPEFMTSSQLHYFMLHGDWHDGRMFWGETIDGTGYTDAFAVDSVPRRFGGVAFSGCCWGALTVSQRAKDAGAAPLAPRVAERSIALSYLKAGAMGFVGCTGSHYSGPDPSPEANFAVAMHSNFWHALSKGEREPAPALQIAREEYSRYIASRSSSMDPVDLARHLKNRAQFTCLGLGW